MKLHLPQRLFRSLIASLLALTLSPQLLAVTNFENQTTSLAGPYTEGITATNSHLTTALQTDVTGSTDTYATTLRLDTSTLTNAANIATSIHSSANWGDALYLAKDSTLTNRGELSLITEGTQNSGTAFGAYSTSHVINEEGASMSVIGSGNGKINGFTMSRESSFSNSGEFSITLNSYGATAMLLDKTSFTNSATGVINISSHGTGSDITATAQGIIASAAPFTNEGSITIKAVSDTLENVTAQGLRLARANTTVYNGKDASISIDVTARHAEGLALDTNTETTNDGNISIEVTGTQANGSLTGAILYTSTLTNSGNIEISTHGAEGAQRASTGLSLSSSTLTNKGCLDITTHDAVGSRTASTGLAASYSTITNAKGATLSIAATGEKPATSVSVSESKFYQAGGLKADKVQLAQNTQASGGFGSPIKADGSTLYLLDNSTTGAQTEGGTMSITSSAKSSVHLGGTLDATGQLTNTERGSIVNLSSSLVISGGKLQLADDVAVKLNGELSLNNVTVNGLGSFSSSDGTALTLNAEGVTFVVDASNSALGGQALAFSTGDSLIETQVAPKTLIIQTPLLNGVNVNGDITLDLSYWQETIDSEGYDNIVFSLGNDVSFAKDSSITATLGSDNHLGYTTATDGAVTFYLNGAPPPVPEPTTATLSLLALAALAARRRRN